MYNKLKEEIGNNPCLDASDLPSIIIDTEIGHQLKLTLDNENIIISVHDQPVLAHVSWCLSENGFIGEQPPELIMGALESV